MDERTKERITSALNSGKLDHGFSIDYIGILGGNDSSVLNETIPFTVEGKYGLDISDLGKTSIKSEPGAATYVGNTTYGRILDLVENQDMYKFHSPKSIDMLPYIKRALDKWL